MEQEIARYVVQLAYLDDSGSDAKSPIAVFGGVVIEDGVFAKLETHVGVVVEELVTEEKAQEFDEFHAAELFGGFGTFHGIPEPERHQAIRSLLKVVGRFKLPYIYAAVDKQKLLASPFRSSAPVDVAFNLCALGVEAYLAELPPPPGARPSVFNASSLGVIVVDDTDDKALKQALKRSFRAMRMRMRGPVEQWGNNRLWRIHDDMYFGDSKDSVGIQIADVCNYFMMRKLRGEDDGDFYDLLQPQARCYAANPEFSQCEPFLKLHGPAVAVSDD